MSCISVSFLYKKNGQGQKIPGTTCYLMNIFVWGKVQMVEALLVSINHINEN